MEKCDFPHHLQQRFGISLLNGLVREFQNAVVNDEKNHIFQKMSRDKKYFLGQNCFDFPGMRLMSEPRSHRVGDLADQAEKGELPPP